MTLGLTQPLTQMEPRKGSCMELSCLGRRRRRREVHLHIWCFIQHPVPSVNITHMFVVLCMITCIIPFPCSSQKLQFVGERCIFVTICTSFLSLQTIAVKSSVAQTRHCLVSLNCRKAVKSGGIPFLLGHDPTTTDFSLCWAAR